MEHRIIELQQTIIDLQAELMKAKARINELENPTYIPCTPAPDPDPFWKPYPSQPPMWYYDNTTTNGTGNINCDDPNCGEESFFTFDNSACIGCDNEIIKD